LKSLGNKKKQWFGMGTNWSLKEQLMWNDIQKQGHCWESNQLITEYEKEYLKSFGHQQKD